MPAHIILRTSGGAETVTDRAAGTPVERAGPTGRVKVGVVSTLTTTTVTVRGRQSGNVVCDTTFTPVTGALAALDLNANHFIFEGILRPGEPIEVTIVAAAAASTLVGVITY
jgi:hypothetical protein